MDLSVTEKTILAVLAYSSQFGHPLTKEDLINRVFKSSHLSFLEDKKITFKKTPSKQDFSAAIRSLEKRNLIFQKRNLYALSKSQLIKKNNKEIKKFKVDVIDDLVSLSNKLPWVLGVVITGSYAAGVIERKDDLDFLIITKKNRLWLTRLMFLFLSLIKGRRPHLPQGDLSHSWDFNFWLDETSLTMSDKKRSIYEAYEILQTKWVVNKKGIKERFFNQNKWVYDYFLFADFPRLMTKNDSKNELGLDPLNWLEKISFFIQTYYRQMRHGKQNTSLHSAFFHQNSTRRNILNNWKKQYLRALSSKKVLVTGVFDVLHQEHKRFLKEARAEGDYLIIGIETDERVRKIKGEGRPVNNEKQRVESLERLKIADEVFVLPSKFKKQNDFSDLIKKIGPDVLAVSSHTFHLGVKRKIMASFGGKVKVVLKHNPKFSSTKIINGS